GAQNGVGVSEYLLATWVIPSRKDVILTSSAFDLLLLPSDGVGDAMWIGAHAHHRESPCGRPTRRHTPPHGVGWRVLSAAPQGAAVAKWQRSWTERLVVYGSALSAPPLKDKCAPGTAPMRVRV